MGKYAYVGLWVKFALRKICCVSYTGRTKSVPMYFRTECFTFEKFPPPPLLHSKRYIYIYIHMYIYAYIYIYIFMYICT